MIPQKEALKVLKMGENVFLTGPAGSGKTYVLNEYIEFLKSRGVEVAVTASTGIAATHLKGVTIHSWSGIGIKDRLSPYDLEALEEKAYLWKRFEKTKVLVIDEISMLSASTLDCVDRVCKLFKRNELPFGGMQVVFSGDFFQLPPIQRTQSYSDDGLFFDEPQESTTPFAFTSDAWKNSHLHVCYLSEQHRQEDSDLLSILDAIREGVWDEEYMRVLEERIVEHHDEEITMLYTHNVNVDAFNGKKLNSIDTPLREYVMSTSGKAPLIETLKRGCLVPENLIIKEGAFVMFVKNNPSVGYVNGTTGVVIGYSNDGYPIVETKDGREYVATPQSWSIEEGSKVLAEISQVPLKLAWAVTIHKSQGMTLDRAVIDLSSSFVEGQGYVALSRVKTLDGLFLKGFNQMSLEVHQEVRHMDGELRSLSSLLSTELQDLVEDEFIQRHERFLESIGVEKGRVLKKSNHTLSTYDRTRLLLTQKMSLEDMVEEREVQKNTLLNHIETLLERGDITKEDILYLQPETDEFKEMIKKMRKEQEALDTGKLTPLFRALDEKYSFDDLRFGRLFC